ncbi:MAG: DUF1990 family protein, partial [Pseudonocardiaceae bacterium]
SSTCPSSLSTRSACHKAGRRPPGQAPCPPHRPGHPARHVPLQRRTARPRHAAGRPVFRATVLPRGAGHRVIDETRGSEAGAERVWGWSYQTLQGHLEQGRRNYEVIKNLASGQVAFRVSGYSRRAPVRSPVIRWGFRLFGRWTQERFYRAIQRRLRDLLQAAQRGEPPPVPTVRADGVAIAPSGATPHLLERLVRGSHQPGS